MVVLQVVLLQRQLGEALAELQANRDRLAEVEAIQVRFRTSFKIAADLCPCLWHLEC